MSTAWQAFKNYYGQKTANTNYVLISTKLVYPIKEVIMAENEKPPELMIVIPPETAKGEYVNLTAISHSGIEFTLDFAQVMVGMKNGVVRQRAIMTPMIAKSHLESLAANIAEYEAKYGKIELEKNPLPIIVPPDQQN